MPCESFSIRTRRALSSIRCSVRRPSVTAVSPLRRAVEGDVENGSLMSGQVAALVHERKTAAEVIDELVREACALGARDLAEMARANAARERA